MNILDRIPAWVAFLGLILIGAIMVVIGIFFSKTAKLGFIDFGSAAVVVGIVSWAGGASGKIVGREGTVGLRVAITNLPWWGWLIDVAAVAAAFLIFFLAK